MENKYTEADLLEVMNLGMELRQNQLNGTDLRSGNEVLEQWKSFNESSKTSIEKRAKSLKWWNNLPFTYQYELFVKNKSVIIGYPERDIRTLTGSEIEKIYNLENK